MPCADIERVSGVRHAKGLDERIVVEKGLTLSHGNEISHPAAEVTLDEGYLLRHLIGGEVAAEALATCRTERAFHGASHLGGETYGQTLVVLTCRHGDGLDHTAVMETHYVLPGSILGDLAVDQLAGCEGVVLCELSSEILREVGHLVIRDGMFSHQPLVELLGTEFRLAIS